MVKLLCPRQTRTISGPRNRIDRAMAAFSGGSGALPADPAAAGAVRVLGLGTLAVCVAIGLYLARVAGAGILLVGIPGVLLVLAYTPWLTRHPWLCLAAPGIAAGDLSFRAEGDRNISLTIIEPTGRSPARSEYSHSTTSGE